MAMEAVAAPAVMMAVMVALSVAVQEEEAESPIFFLRA